MALDEISARVDKFNVTQTTETDHGWRLNGTVDFVVERARPEINGEVYT
jgi:hypothetical protein